MTSMFEIPVADIDALHALPDHPLILRGFHPRTPCTGLGDLLYAAGCAVLSGYRADPSGQWVEVSAGDAVAAFEAGILDINVVDCPVSQDFDPADRLDVPGLMDRDNLFLMHPDWRVYRKSLVITQRGTRTPMHVDPCGMAGWMYLYAGRKHWELWAPSAAPLFYDLVGERYHDDKDGHAHPDPHCAASLAGLPYWSGTVGPGEILWFPEGWLHRVETLEDSYGYGGSTLHRERLEQAVQAWLWERRLGFSPGADLREVLRAATGQGHDASAFLSACDTAFAAWERNRS